MDAAVENLELKRGELLEEHQTGSHCPGSTKDLLEQEEVSTDSGSEYDSATSESGSDDSYEADSTIRLFKKRSFADQGGGDADVSYDSDCSSDTVIVSRSPKKETLPPPKKDILLCDETEATSSNPEKQSTADQQLDSLCKQMKELKMEHQDGCKNAANPFDQVSSRNMLKLDRDNDELDREKEREAIAQEQKKQIAHDLFQEWLQSEYRRCDGEDLSRTERPMRQLVPTDPK